MTRQQEFLQLLQQHKGVLYKVTRLYADKTEDRDDLVQEITYQLWKTYDSFEGKSTFSTWMYKVALNTAFTFLRKEKKKIDNAALEEHMDFIAENHDDSQEEKLKYFYAAVQELNHIEKALIFLFLEGIPHKEIASNLGITEVNARVKLNRTKEKLQLIIQKNGYEF